MATILSIIGAILSAWYLRHSELMPIIWNVAPYILTGVLSLVVKTPYAPSVLLGAVLAMLFVDGWLYVETSLGTNSPVLFAISLASTLKLIAVLPIGALIGYVLHKLQA